MSQEIQDMLKVLGLSGYEARAYFGLLTLGIADARAVSRKTGIPTGRVYDVLNGLSRKNFIEVQDSRPKKFKAVVPQIVLEDLLRSKRKEFDKKHEQLTLMVQSVEKELSRVTKMPRSHNTFWSVAIGQKDIHNLFAKRIAEAREDILSYLELERYDQEDDALFEKIHESLEKGVDMKILLSVHDAENLEDYGFLPAVSKISSFIGHNLNIRVVSEIHNPYDVIDGKRVTIKVKNPRNPLEYFAAISVWDKNLAQELKEKFYAIWETSNPLDYTRLLNTPRLTV